MNAGEAEIRGDLDRMLENPDRYFAEARSVAAKQIKQDIERRLVVRHRREGPRVRYRKRTA